MSQTVKEQVVLEIVADTEIIAKSWWAGSPRISNTIGVHLKAFMNFEENIPDI